MRDDKARVLNLGAFTDADKALLKSDYSYKKQQSQLMKAARQAAKRDTCFFCEKSVTGFCNSHSVPRFCLENIATNGDVCTLNSVVDNPLMDTENGINRAGTFHLICNDCDSRIFSDYENPANYSDPPTPKMIAQMALKNSLKSLSKRLFEIELYRIISQKSKNNQMFCNAKNTVNELDLKEYMESFQKAKKALEKGNTSAYYVCWYEKLNYVVPIAFQCSLALAVDFNGKTINNFYDLSPKNRIQNINISILPLKSETVIVLFVEDGDKRYRQFKKQFNKLTLEDKLSALTLIMFLYSEDMFFSKSILKEVRDSYALCKAGKTGLDIISFDPVVDVIEVLKRSHSLDKRHEIPNLLSEKYKMEQQDRPKNSGHQLSI